MTMAVTEQTRDTSAYLLLGGQHHRIPFNISHFWQLYRERRIGFGLPIVI